MAIKYNTIEEYREAQRVRVKKYYQENREKILAYKKEAYKRKKAAEAAAKEQEINTNK